MPQFSDFLFVWHFSIAIFNAHVFTKTSTNKTMSRVNQKSLASLAGVSRATVSRALANHPAISPAVSEHIRDLARRMNYRPNAAARSFVTRRNNSIGLILCDRSLVVPVYGKLSAAVAAATQELGLKLQFSLCSSADLKQNDLPPMFRDDGIDGVLLVGSVPDSLLERIASWSMPFVMIGTRQGVAGINQIAGDPVAGGAIAAEHLLQLGHRRFGILVGPRNRAIHADYWEGFTRACRRAGLSAEELERSTEEVLTNDAIEPMQRLMSRVPDLTALFADTDLIAWQAAQYLRTIGRSVPAQVSVIGAGNVLDLPNPDIRLTTVDTRLDEMGRAAVQRLRELISNVGESSRRVLVDPVLLPGATTFAPPAATAQENAGPSSEGHE